MTMYPDALFRTLLAAMAIAVPLVVTAGGQQPKFFPDDPLRQEPRTQDASKVQRWEIPLTPDLLLNMFGEPGDPVLGQRAKNINTIDEVPDSSWFTNRIYTRPVSLEEMAAGPNTMAGPAPGRWTVIRPKTAGVSPGFTVRDERGEVWFLSFDARQNPVAATAASMVATKLFWALGYNQVETYLTKARPELIDIDPEATVRAHGRRRPLTEKDIAEVFARAARSADGSYRAVAGRAVPGRTIGGFRYFGTRPDDPNDVVPHEHRRELRALQVFGAWTNLVDLKAGNTLDTVIDESGRAYVKHYLQDVGSTFGTGALAPRDGDEGYELTVDLEATLKRAATLGLWMQPWQTIRHEEHPEIGRFEAAAFEPEKWTPRVMVAALRHARPDDLLWASLRVMAFTDEQIRTAVRAGGYSDPGAEALLTTLLAQRRDKIGSEYFARVNPLTRFALSEAGELTFANPAVHARLTEEPAKGYEAAWARFDNLTRESRPLATTSGSDGRLRAPADLPAIPGSFLRVSIKAVEPPHEPWGKPVEVYFRRDPGGWTLVGVER